MSLLQANLERLAAHNPALARQISEAAESSRVSLDTSRSGLPVAAIHAEAGSGRPLWLHSRIDPQREAARLVASSGCGGFCLVLGLGLGYHVLELLKSNRVQAVLIVEHDVSLLRTLLRHGDLRHILQDPRVTLVADLVPLEVAQWVSKRYLPLVQGDFSTLLLRGRVDTDRELFSEAGRAAAAAARDNGADLAVQRVFGRQWMRNIVRNAAQPPSEQIPLPQAARAIVAAAGPSLDGRLETLAQRGSAELLIATDTALPALRGAGITPDVVVAIDCQLVSYLHIVGAADRRTLLVADLGVHPALMQSFARVHTVGGAHPLLRYLHERGLAFSFLDSSDGSVTHAAVRLAAQTGARRIDVYGADFSYPRAAAYVRASYIHTDLLCRSSRLAPAAGRLYRFVVDRPDVTLERVDGRRTYVTPVMRRYRDRFNELCAAVEARVVRHVDAVTVGSRPGAERDAPRTAVRMAPLSFSPKTGIAQRRESPGRAVLHEYSLNLRRLQPPSDPLWRHFAGLALDRHQLWLTLLPLAAYYSGAELPAGSAALLEHTRRRALELLACQLKTSPAGHGANPTTP